jgi:hypothetical protein
VLNKPHLSFHLGDQGYCLNKQISKAQKFGTLCGIVKIISQRPYSDSYGGKEKGKKKEEPANTG